MRISANQPLASLLQSEWPIYLMSVLGLGLALGYAHHSTPFVLVLVLLALPQVRQFYAEAMQQKALKPLAITALLFFLVASGHEFITAQDQYAGSAVKPILCMLLIMPFYHRIRHAEQLFAYIVIAGSLTVGFIAGYDRLVLDQGRIGGGHNAIMFSLISSMLWFCAIIHVGVINNKPLKLALLLAAFACTPAILFSGSRTAWLYVATTSPAVLLWLWFKSDLQTRKWLGIGLLLVTPLVGVTALTDEETLERITYTYTDTINLINAKEKDDEAYAASFGIRAGLTYGAMHIIKTSPLGGGLESFYAHMRKQAREGNAHSLYLSQQFKPHNQVLLAGVMFGWPGMACLVLLWAAMVITPLTAARSSNTRGQHFYLLASFVAASLILFCQTDTPMAYNMPAVWVYWLYFCLLGLGHSCTQSATVRVAA
jgi:O-antigen ligase